MRRMKHDLYNIPILAPKNSSVLIEGSQLRFDFNVQEIRGPFVMNFHSLHHQAKLFQILPAEF